MRLIRFFDSAESKLERICKKTGEFAAIDRILRRNLALNINVLRFDNNEHTLLHLATISGFSKCVEVLLSRGANSSCRVTSSGNTCLHIASWMGRLTIVQLLCSREDVQIDDISDDGFTALALACWAGQLEVCMYLLSLGASPLIKNQHGYTPLILASRCGNFDIVQHLLKSGASDVNDTDNDGCTSLHHACFEGRKDIVRLLVKQGIAVDFADKKGRVAKELCKTREIAHIIASIHDKCVRTRHRTTFKLSLRDQSEKEKDREVGGIGMNTNAAGGDTSVPTKDDTRALASELSQRYLLTLSSTPHQAGSAGGGGRNTVELDTAKVFSHPTPDVSKTGTRGVWSLTDDNSDDDVKDSNGDPSGLYVAPKVVRECWRLCSSSGDYKALKRLLVAHPSLTVGKPTALTYLRDLIGWTLLMRAVDNNFLEIVKILTTLDPNSINLSCPHGRTPLHLAASKNHEEILRVLLSTSLSEEHSSVNSSFDAPLVHVDRITDVGRTAFHYATEFGHVEICRKLAYRGADENVQDKNGFSPLHLACLHSHSEVIIFLLTECSANPLAITSDGEFPEDLTVSSRIKRLLRAVSFHRKQSTIEGYNFTEAWNPVEEAVIALRSTTSQTPVKTKENTGTETPRSNIHNDKKQVTSPVIEKTGTKTLVTSTISPGNTANFKRAAWDLISKTKKAQSVRDRGQTTVAAAAVTILNRSKQRSLVSTTKPPSGSGLPGSNKSPEANCNSHSSLKIVTTKANENDDGLLSLEHMSIGDFSGNASPVSVSANSNGNNDHTYIDLDSDTDARTKMDEFVDAKNEKEREGSIALDENSHAHAISDSTSLRRDVRSVSNASIISSTSTSQYASLKSPRNTNSENDISSESLLTASMMMSARSGVDSELSMRGNELKGSLLLTMILSQVYNVYANKISKAFYRWKHRNTGARRSNTRVST